MRPLIACVPNFSEGRRTSVIEAIEQAIRRAGAVYVLNVNSDYDHNRTVITFAGTPEEVEKSAFAGIKVAVEHIQLDEHEGVHPRLGAADVVPFVPIRRTKMAECVALAQRLGQRVGDELRIPVYLYERAATRTDRTNLANIRNTKFQYEHLKTAIQTDANYLPDFGPAELGPAGAIAIGARQSLIAFNVYLNTDDVSIAQNIAASVRASGGGLAYVKAAGFLVNGLAQVSMNLTDYRKTPIFRVVEMIRREAQRYGVLIKSTELIGMAPQKALVDTAQWYLQLDNFSAEQLLEQRIAEAEAEAATAPLAVNEPPVPSDATGVIPTVPGMEQKIRPSAFVESVAAADATPGGGAVAALSGALAAALVEMVSGLTVNKPRYADVKSEIEETLQKATALREQLLDNVVRDADAFRKLIETVRLSADDPERMTQLVENSYAVAQIPLSVCQQALEVLEISRTVIRTGNRSVIADAIVALHMATAAAESASVAMRVNLIGFEDDERAKNMLTHMQQMLQSTRDMRDAVLEEAYQRAGLNS